MATSTVPDGGGSDESVPYLPARTPDPAGEHSSPLDGSHDAPHGPVHDESGQAGDQDGRAVVVETLFADPPTGAPYVPESKWAPPVPSPPVFDAKKMVASQRRTAPSPSYGQLPAPTDHSEERTDLLREQGRRKRRRDRWLARVALLLLLAGFGALLYVAFGAANEPDGPDDELAGAPADRAAEQVGSAPFTPTAGSVEMTDVSSPSTIVVEVESLPVGPAPDGSAQPPGASGAATIDRPTDADVALVEAILPPVLADVAARLPDPSGRETYVVGVDEFAAADQAAFVRFVEAVASQPQLDAGAPAFEGLPQVGDADIVVSVDRDGEMTRHIVVVAGELGLHVDLHIEG